jgi:hypothetical protein
MLQRFSLSLVLLGIALLAVQPPGRAGGGDHRLTFRAEVDDAAIIYVSHHRIMLETTDEPVRNLSYQFKSSFPKSAVEVHFKSKKGRGRLEIIQQPSRSNDYTAAIRITDPDRARSTCEFELAWD